jgi:hypothetical protein
MENKQASSALDTNTMEKDTRNTRQSSSDGQIFKIRVKGHLNSKWSDWFEGLELVLLDNGETVLAGRIVDQAALIGIINKLYRLNLNLLSINKVEEERSRELPE